MLNKHLLRVMVPLGLVAAMCTPVCRGQERAVSVDEFYSWLRGPLASGKGKAIAFFGGMPTGSKGDFLGEFGPKMCRFPKANTSTHEYFVVIYPTGYYPVMVRHLDAVAEVLKKHGCPATIIKVRNPANADPDMTGEAISRQLGRIYTRRPILNYSETTATWSAVHDGKAQPVRTYENLFFE